MAEDLVQAPQSFVEPCSMLWEESAPQLENIAFLPKLPARPGVEVTVGPALRVLVTAEFVGSCAVPVKELRKFKKSFVASAGMW
jgi:hypothetical protein